MKIYKNTVSETLWFALNKLMSLEILDNFRLVGGTSLSLMIGHRMSIDIDLFTDSKYGSVDFVKIRKILKKEFNYFDGNDWSNQSMGNTCFIGNNEEDIIKLDLFYTDSFAFPIYKVDKLRLSQLEEIAAMKLEVIGNGGRKKDFWDIHALSDSFTIGEMIDFYLKRYPYNHCKKHLEKQILNFDEAENDPDPKCLKGHYWELIKLDIEEMM